MKKVILIYKTLGKYHDLRYFHHNITFLKASTF